MSPLNAASWRRAAAAAVLLAAVTGCHTVGPQAVHTARIDYDEAMTAAYNEQLLLNLVRLRYRDTPHFLEVSSLVTEHVLGASASASALLGAGAADVGVSVGGTYEESPKVVYAPLAGKQFVTRMLTPIQVETLYLLMRSGWSVERVLRCCVREMSGLVNAPSADGPTPTATPRFAEFAAFAHALRDLQEQHRLRLDLVPAETKAAEAADGPEAEFLLVFSDPADAAALRSRFGDELGGALDERAGYPVLPLHPGRLGSTEVGLVLHTRSLIGVFYLLSQGVEAPPEDVERGFVTRTAAGSEAPRPWSTNVDGGDCRPAAWTGGGLDWPRTVLRDLFTVHVASREPRDAFVRVRYRGHWFYVPDCDLQSKSTFSLLVQLFALQSGDPKERASSVLFCARRLAPRPAQKAAVSAPPQMLPGGLTYCLRSWPVAVSVTVIW